MAAQSKTVGIAQTWAICRTTGVGRTLVGRVHETDSRPRCNGRRSSSSVVTNDARAWAPAHRPEHTGRREGRRGRVSKNTVTDGEVVGGVCKS